MDTNNEIWKPIGVKNYEVSNFGNVRNTKHGQTYLLKKNTNNSKGYERIGLMITDKLQKHYSVHRLVALAFIPNPENKREVNHKDECKTNNHYTNLEWTTPSENVRHSIETWRRKAKKRAVACYDSNGNLIKSYVSQKSVENDGYDHTFICKVVKGKQKTAYGYTWKYL